MSVRSKNFLDYVPAVSEKNEWEIRNNIVTIHVTHRGLWATLAHTVFRRPRVSHITLDAYGSFIFRSMDGHRSVEELARLLKERFGGEVEPLYPRLVPYLRILRNNRFIVYVKRGIYENTNCNKSRPEKKE